MNIHLRCGIKVSVPHFH